jgi:hypothetical protein
MRVRLKRRVVLVGAVACLVAATCWLFPGQRLGLAFTLATGVGTSSLQDKIDALESKAVRREPFSAEDRELLSDFYRTLATGAKLSVLVAQTGHLMDHYLDGSGKDFELGADIYRDNAKVQRQLGVLRQRLGKSCKAVHLESPTFYMPDTSKIDSVFGLYHGRVFIQQEPGLAGACVRHVRAEVPWFWPSYASLRDKYGSAHAESFPLPNAQSLLFGQKLALYVDNGLGQYLVELGLAKPFLAYAEWDE